MSKSTVDTAGIAQEDISELTPPELIEPIADIVVPDEVLDNQSAVIVYRDSIGFVSSDTLISIEEEKELAIVPLEIQDYQPKNKLKYAPRIEMTKNGPPEWWGNMWRAIFKFFLMWVLIAVAVVAVIYGLVIGITALALWIGGPIAAAITCIVLIIVIQLVFDIDLSWLV